MSAGTSGGEQKNTEGAQIAWHACVVPQSADCKKKENKKHKCAHKRFPEWQLLSPGSDSEDATRKRLCCSARLLMLMTVEPESLCLSKGTFCRAAASVSASLPGRRTTWRCRQTSSWTRTSTGESWAHLLSFSLLTEPDILLPFFPFLIVFFSNWDLLQCLQ